MPKAILTREPSISISNVRYTKSMQRKLTSKRIKYGLFLVMMAATIILSIDNYNAGIYADEQGLNGAHVGWFAPHGFVIFFITAIITFAYGLYLLASYHKK